MRGNEEKLAVIMPCYNEESAIPAVIDKWTKELNAIGMNYKIHVYNDGSQDMTLQILHDIALTNQLLVIHDKENTGHGPTILNAYRENVDSDWIFQIDSDDEMSPTSFRLLWEKRNNYDFLIGKRENNKRPVTRKLISFISRVTVRIFYGKGIWDVNSPYRLMRTAKLKESFFTIPGDTFAPNVILSGIASLKRLKYIEVPVPHQNRQTGEVSIKKLKLLKAVVRSFFQTMAYRIRSV